MTEKYISRILETSINNALLEYPIVIVMGARQIGKSTLAEQYEKVGYKYVSLDTPVTFEVADAQPTRFLNSLGDKVIIDEVQKLPKISNAIQDLVNRSKWKKRFILTGSVSFLELKNVQERFSTRACTFVLYPMSQIEIEAKKSKIIETMFASDFIPSEYLPFTESDFHKRIIEGGFYKLTRSKNRVLWASNYLSEVKKILIDTKEVQKNSTDNIFYEVVKNLAKVSSCKLNVDNLARNVNIHRNTCTKYLSYIHKLFLFHQLKVWDRKLLLSTARKTPKIHFCDAGLICALLEIRDLTSYKKKNPKTYGYIFETFVFNELLRICSNSDKKLSFSYYQKKYQKEIEVDIIIQNENEKVVGIEVKSSKRVNIHDFRGLKDLQKQAGEDFAAGIIIHTGEGVRNFRNNLWAIPVHFLWELDENYYNNNIVRLKPQ